MKNITDTIEMDILNDRGFTPISDLNFCTEEGTEYYIGYHKKLPDAAIVALITNEDNFLLNKKQLREMSDTAKTYDIKNVWLYTNYGVEIHSKYEKPGIVGLHRIIKINSEGFNS